MEIYNNKYLMNKILNYNYKKEHKVNFKRTLSIIENKIYLKIIPLNTRYYPDENFGKRPWKNYPSIMFCYKDMENASTLRIYPHKKRIDPFGNVTSVF